MKRPSIAPPQPSADRGELPRTLELVLGNQIYQCGVQMLDPLRVGIAIERRPGRPSAVLDGAAEIAAALEVQRQLRCDRVEVRCKPSLQACRDALVQELTPRRRHARVDRLLIERVQERVLHARGAVGPGRRFAFTQKLRAVPQTQGGSKLGADRGSIFDAD